MRYRGEGAQMNQEALIKELMSIPGKVISLHDGAYLYREGAPAHYFYIVRSGHIFVVKYGASGRVLALRLATKGSLVGDCRSTRMSRPISLVRLRAVPPRSTPSSFPYWRRISKSIRTSLSRC